METKLRASSEQFSTLLEYMESHGDLSNPQGGLQRRLKCERLWCKLVGMLNYIDGGVNKPIDKWKKVWADWKCKTKKKALLIRHQRASGTSGGPSSRQTLSTFEERVLTIMGNLTAESLPNIQEQGFTRPLSSSTQALTPQDATHQQDEQIDIETATADVCVAKLPPVTPPPFTSSQPPHANIGAHNTSTAQRDLSARRNSRLQSASAAMPSRCRPPSTRRQRLPSTTPSEARVASPTRVTRKTRRKRTLTPFDRATNDFVAIEQERLRVEEQRDRQLHERETRRIEVDHERNQILRTFADIAQAWLDLYRSKADTEQLEND